MSSPQDASSPCLPARGMGYRCMSSANSSVPLNQSGVDSQQQEQLLIDLDETSNIPPVASLLPLHAATASSLDRDSSDLLTPLNSSIPPLTADSGNTVAGNGGPVEADASVTARSSSPSALDNMSGANRSDAGEVTVRARQLSLPMHAHGVNLNMAPLWSARSGHPSVGLSSVNVQQRFAGMSITGETRTSSPLSETLLPDFRNGVSSRAIPQSTHTSQPMHNSSLNPFRNRLLQQREAQQHWQEQRPSPSSVPSTSASPLVQTQSERSSRMSSYYVPPPWQPDSDVSACPICHHEFSFWYRKHHCRKCGRVVCANCSPHRITIPRQYIVRPPNQEADSPGQITSGFPGSAHTSTGATLRRASVEQFPQSFDGQEAATHTQEEAGSAPESLAGFANHNHTLSEQSASTPDAFFNYFTLSHRPLSQSSATGMSGNFASAGNPALGGGEEVRLCNPCVPDPNLEPPADHLLGSRLYDISASTPHNTAHTRSLVDTAQAPAGGGCEQSHLSASKDGGLVVDMQSSDATTRGFNLESQQPQRTETRRHQFSRHADNRHHDIQGGRSLPALASSTIPLRLTRGRHSRSGQSDITEPQAELNDRDGRHEARPTRHRRRVPEEDICPVCSHPLPPVGPNGSEASREEHISACIENATASLTGATSTSTAIITDSISPYPNALRVSPQTVNGPNPAPAPRTVVVTPPSPSSSRAGRHPSSKNPHLMRMLSFTATEKDCCITSDGQPQECTICMEEYSIGEKLARLECLCKFHKKCVVEWFERKPECPVHKTPSWEEP
ncbi:hypothetical protein KEM54_005492 [Ascosphaera aggregata]|nr:hypothetical protein KEM54_005492 [Ascosphaera aggregata]